MHNFLVGALLSLAIGGLVGLERERREARFLGVRTFAIITLLGFLLAFFGGDSKLFPAIGLIGVFALAVAYYYFRVKSSYYKKDAIGLTTTLIIPLAFFLGSLVGYDYFLEAGIIAIASVYLLLEKKEVHAVVRTISREEFVDLLLFAIIAFIIYPQLPPEVQFLGFAFNLQYFWFIIVLVSLISFLAHILIKYLHENAVFYAAFLGGAMSSLATISLFLKKTRLPDVIFTILVATSLGALASDILLLALINSALVAKTFLVLLLPLIGFVLAALHWKRKSNLDESMKAEKHALSLKFTVEFAVLFFVVFSLVSWAAKNQVNLFLASAVGGLLSATSVFAVIAYEYSQGMIQTEAAAFALLAALLASLAAKSFLVGVSLKDSKTMWRTAVLLAFTAALGVLGAFLSLGKAF